MPKLTFRYGTMNSAKTANLLMMAFNLRSKGRDVFLVKPSVDTRGGMMYITSRALESIKADLILKPKDVPKINTKNIDCILVDECQFLTATQVDSFRQLSLDVPVICYGLRTDFRTRLFEGSSRLFEIADTIEEIKTNCTVCTAKATINAKYINIDEHKIIVRDGNNIIDIGSEDKYQSMCWKCWSTMVLEDGS